MNTESIISLSLGTLFLLLALLSMILKNKTVNFISGFNTLSKEEQAQYDIGKMTLDFQKMLLIWTGLFQIGALISFYLPQVFYIVLIIWLFLFFKNVNLDAKKAFAKYKRY